MIAGRYTLEREIGRGGAGVVHLGRDEVLGRAVAIKRMGLLPGTTEDDVARAEREARLAAGVNHPHVVSILDLVKDDDCYWLVMEHVEGRTLTELIVAEGPLSPSRAAGIIAQAADALVEANQAGIVHRDVKPSNIMVDDRDHAKLGDFGIARSATDAALTRTGLVTGSPAYLAPEVASGSDATAASDVWSLGATLWHAVMGRAPYDMGQNVLGGLYRIVHDGPPRLPDDHPLATPLAGMMQKDPDQRWPVARARDELRHVARGPGPEPRPGDDPDREATVGMATVPAPAAPTPVAGPTPVAASNAPPSGRRPLARLAAVAALVVLVGLGAWLWWPEDANRDTAAEGAGTGQSQPSEQPSASQEPTQEPSAEPTEEPTAEPTETEPTTDAAPEGDAAAMEVFVEDYYSQVTSDPQVTFEMLTPGFQTESGGFGRYSGFWSTIESASVSDVRADPEALTTSYTVQYVTTSGRTTTQQGRLQLQQSGDGYLIAGEG
ncbi:Serine/threonine protein kinase [Nocardioides alpinus]|uniref:non-specific serine/threonine protein kinase n=1 Tax=Nocardioides alpinus TaxID=748909 RepID=A0A1I0XTE8_9ACTN|nr:serine/threonine-protein kinase [Nocardioides alpinus]SFB04419.1 Serine/threonine protein kinase [Nocardioides alpinus]